MDIAVALDVRYIYIQRVLLLFQSLGVCSLYGVRELVGVYISIHFCVGKALLIVISP